MSLGNGLSPYIAPSDCSGNDLCFVRDGVPFHVTCFWSFEKFVSIQYETSEHMGGSWIYSRVVLLHISYCLICILCHLFEGVLDPFKTLMNRFSFFLQIYLSTTTSFS